MGRKDRNAGEEIDLEQDIIEMQKREEISEITTALERMHLPPLYD